MPVTGRGDRGVPIMARGRGDSGVSVTGRARGRLLLRASSRRCSWAGHVRISMVLLRHPTITVGQEPRGGTPYPDPAPGSPQPLQHSPRSSPGAVGPGWPWGGCLEPVGQVVAPADPCFCGAGGDTGGSQGHQWLSRAGKCPLPGGGQPCTGAAGRVHPAGRGASPGHPAASWGWVFSQNTLPHSHQCPTATGILSVAACPTPGGHADPDVPWRPLCIPPRN